MSLIKLAPISIVTRTSYNANSTMAVQNVFELDVMSKIITVNEARHCSF